MGGGADLDAGTVGATVAICGFFGAGCAIFLCRCCWEECMHLSAGVAGRLRPALPRAPEHRSARPAPAEDNGEVTMHIQIIVLLSSYIIYSLVLVLL